MASPSAPLAVEKKRQMPTQTKKVYAISKAPRRSDRLRARHSTKEKLTKTLSDSPQIKKRTLKTRRRTLDFKNHSSAERSRKRLQTQNPSQKKQVKQKRPREEEVPISCVSPKPSAKGVRTSTASVRKTIGEARIEFWRENGIWPTEDQEKTMNRYRDILVEYALSKEKSKPSLSRKRSDPSINSETPHTPTVSGQSQREYKSAPYRHPLYQLQLKERGSFLDDHEEGITARSEKRLAKLLKTRKPPKHTLFSDDVLFNKTCDSIMDENETKVILRIGELIFPSAELLAHRGAKHLSILKDTTNAGWINAIPFYGPRPQPDFGLGFKREAFTREQLQKLRPFIGNQLKDHSYVAATYQMYFPFFTSEVKCGASALDIADRQNLHSQTVSLRNLIELFRQVGRLNDLHRKIKGYSISHNHQEVRIWAHYVVIKGEEWTFHRHLVAKFLIRPSATCDERWRAWNFVMNVYDRWVPRHFKKICSAIDMIPAGLNFDVSNLSESQRPDPEPPSSSGLTEQIEDHGLADEGVMSDGQPSG